MLKIRQLLPYLVTLDELHVKASCRAGRWRPISGDKLEAWRILHIFRFLRTDRDLEILGPFLGILIHQFKFPARLPYSRHLLESNFVFPEIKFVL